MAGDCVFCRIIRGEAPCSMVYDSPTVISFLDINPVHHGHALVVPKEHFPTLFELPVELGRDLFEAMQKVGQAVMDVTGAQGMHVGMNNFEAGNQVVFHAHFHIIPRFTGAGLRCWRHVSYETPDERRRVAESIRRLAQAA
jgi:histidine triad (HIT) family protein